MRAVTSRKFHKVIAVLGLVFGVCMLTFLWHTPIYANASEVTEGTTGITGTLGDATISVTAGGEDTTLASTLQILILLTVLTLAPSILIMVTSFTRILVVLHFVRSALGTQTTPPNQILIGLALFLTLFIMTPTLSEVNTAAVQPLSAGEITAEEALSAGIEPIRKFMFSQVRNEDLSLFLEMGGVSSVETPADVPTHVLIPAFILSELRAGFIMGFLIYIPFIIIDMVVSSTLMSMGMMMLPPTTISMPFKILLFIMADGWNLIIGEVVRTFTGG